MQTLLSSPIAAAQWCGMSLFHGVKTFPIVSGMVNKLASPACR